MNKIKYIALLLLYAGCTNVTNTNHALKDMKAVAIKNQYTINVPNYLSPSETMLSEDASLTYSNKDKEFYLMIIDEVRGDKDGNGEQLSLKDYFQRSTDNIAAGLTDTKNTQPEKFNLNGLNCIRMTIGGMYNTLPMVYKCYIVEGATHFYQIYCWTISDLLSQNERDMNRTLGSFRELPQVK
jgi:hypothetical protein